MTKEIMERLKAPFHPSEIKSRQGFGKNAKQLHYVDARVVQDRLDDVFGIENWQVAYETKVGREGVTTTLCTISVRINGEWINKTDGAGITQVEEEKGAISDAFKRAAVTLGIGRYLYVEKDPIAYYNEYNNITNTVKPAVKDTVISINFEEEFKKCKTIEELETLRKDNKTILSNHKDKEKLIKVYQEKLIELRG